jgi:hypothetical protein
MAEEALPIPYPRTVWVPSMMMKAKIQSLRPKEEVEWKAALGEEFPTEDVKEQVIFASFLECGLTSPRVISFRVFSSTTSWSWYILFLTPSS